MSARRGACALDLDGTVVDTVQDICAHANRTLAWLGLPPLPEVEVRAHVGHGARELVAGLLTGSPQHLSRLEDALAFFEDSYTREPATHAVLYPTAHAALDLLEAHGFAATVVTNKPHGIALAVLEKVGVRARLVAVEGARPHLPLKPDPTLLRRALVTAQVERNAVVVGDSGVDVALAERAGIPFAGVDYGMDRGAGIRARGYTPHATLRDAVQEAVDRLHAGASRS